MHVGLDVTALLAGDTGVARYVRELGTALERRGVAVTRYAIGRGPHKHALPAATRRWPVPLRVVHSRWTPPALLPIERLAPRCDVIHVPDLVPPRTTRPLVLTVHDLVALEQPELHPPRAHAAQARQLEAARDSAAIVLAVSRATADALIARGVPSERIVVTPNGVTPLPEPDPSLLPDRPFLLALGSINPRKDLTTLAAAFANAAIPDDTVLVLAGPPGWRGEQVTESVTRAAAPRRVRCLGRVTDAQLAALLRACTAVCVPSIAEGFGLPVVEAAAAGAPVLASDLPVFRELDAACLYAPPCDVSAWSRGLERVVRDEELRAAANTRASTVAAEFTWDRAAALTIEAYERARTPAASTSARA